MMKDNDLKRNASGYYDEPCYKAVTAPPKAGEIWVHAKSGAYMLVIANHNGVCSTLRLSETEREDSITVNCKVPMYTTPIMLGYCFENLLTQFVKTVKAEEFTAVQRGIGKVLGIADVNLAKEMDTLEGSLEAQRAQNMYLRTEVDNLKAKLEETKTLKTESEIMAVMQKDFNETYARLNQEIVTLTIYKDMYMDIIGKLVAIRGNAND